MTTSTTGAAISAAHLSALAEIQNKDVAAHYKDTLDEITTYIISVDDPELSAERQIGWLRTITMIKADINTLSRID